MKRPANTMSHRRILAALAIKKLEKDHQFATGANIARLIANHTGDNYPQLSGSIYGIMNGMRDRGWATNWVENDIYKTWSLTPAGGRALQRTLSEFDSLREAAVIVQRLHAA